MAGSRRRTAPRAPGAVPDSRPSALGGIDQGVEERVRPLEAEALGDLLLDLRRSPVELAELPRAIPGRPQRALRPRGQPRDEGPHGVERRSPEHARRPRARVEHEGHRERALVRARTRASSRGSPFSSTRTSSARRSGTNAPWASVTTRATERCLPRRRASGAAAASRARTKRRMSSLPCRAIVRAVTAVTLRVTAARPRPPLQWTYGGSHEAALPRPRSVPWPSASRPARSRRARAHRRRGRAGRHRDAGGARPGRGPRRASAAWARAAPAPPRRRPARDRVPPAPGGARARRPGSRRPPEPAPPDPTPEPTPTPAPPDRRGRHGPADRAQGRRSRTKTAKPEDPVVAELAEDVVRGRRRAAARRAPR